MLTPDQVLRAELARGDRSRRTRANAVRLWRVAPIVAGVCALVAAIGRILHWPALIPVALLGAALLALTLYAVMARRVHAVTDVVAVELDERARLEGELRSAYWFSGHDARDPWIDFHLARAAERLKTIDWAGLYPPARAPRAKTATALLALVAFVLALFVPGRTGISASMRGPGSQAARGKTAPPRVLSAAEIFAKLENLLITAESGQGRSITASEVRGLLAQLEALMAQQKFPDTAAPKDSGTKQSKAPTAAELKAFAERAKRASESTELQPEVRDALADMSEKLNEQTQAQTAAPKDPKDAVGAEDTQAGESAQAAAGNGKKQDPSGQSVKEAAGGGGIGVIMMTGDSSSSKEAGLGLGGASGTNPKNGQMPDLGAALRKETIEAAQENEGEKNVFGERRQTEHSTATAAYAHTAPAAAGRGRSAAPPAVPEARRAALRSYFIRKQ